MGGQSNAGGMGVSQARCGGGAVAPPPPLGSIHHRVQAQPVLKVVCPLLELFSRQASPGVLCVCWQVCMCVQWCVYRRCCVCVSGCVSQGLSEFISPGNPITFQTVLSPFPRPEFPTP